MTKYEKFQLRSIIFFFVTLIVIFFFLTTPQIATYIETAGRIGGSESSFAAGAFYTSYVTAPAATAAIFFLGKVQHPLSVAFVGAFGSMLADYLLFRFVRKRIRPSVFALAKKVKSNHTKKVLRRIAPAVAFAILASPLPDELGVAILGIAKFKTKKFFLVSYLANFLGILIISWLGFSLV